MTDQQMPDVLAAALDAPWAFDHEGHDFEPYEEFEPPDATASWWAAWTGNQDAGDPPFRVFGVDGSGGQAAIWVREPEAALGTQPVVFLGSEGEQEVLAVNLDDYLWLLAGGVGPLEAVGGLQRTPAPIPELVALAPGEPRSVEAVLAGARELLPALEEFVDEVCAAAE